MSLKEKIFNYLLNKQPKRIVTMPQWDKPCKIAVLHDGGDITALIGRLQKGDTPAAKRQITVFTLPDEKEVCALLDRPKKAVIQRITADQFDLLIDLTQQVTLTSLYMALYIRANFKVGRYTRDGIYDLTINTPPQDTPDFLFEQILKYLNLFTNPATSTSEKQ
jgi:hypothetical protein